MWCVLVSQEPVHEVLCVVLKDDLHSVLSLNASSSRLLMLTPGTCLVYSCGT